MAKYDPLREYLERGTDPISMSFDEIADLVGGLPSSAHLHSAWWANHRGSHVQAAAWLDAGRSVERIDLAARQVRFSGRQPEIDIEVPPIDADLPAIFDFALTFNGYDKVGSLEALQRLSETQRTRWERSGELATDLRQLRGVLFYLQRQEHWTDWFDEDFARAVLRQIGTVSGGVVRGTPYPNL